MKEGFKIQLHSSIDVITNSSSELFIIDIEKGLDTVKKIVKEAFEKFGGYGYMPDVHIENPDYYGDYTYQPDQIEEMIKWLTQRGYKITPPEKEVEPQAIVVSWDMGAMKQDFIKFIEETFNTEVIQW